MLKSRKLIVVVVRLVSCEVLDMSEVIDYIFEIQKDPFKWVLNNTAQGYDKLRLLTFLSIVSSRLGTTQLGVYRIHLLPIGEPSNDIVTAIKSVVRLIEPSEILLTPQSLSSTDGLDGKVFFIENINTRYLYYIKDMIDINVVHIGRVNIKRILGQPSVIVASPINNDRDYVFNKFVKVYVKPGNISQVPEVGEMDKLAFTYYLLSLPKKANISQVFDKAENFVFSIEKYTNYPLTRIAEILRNMLITTTIARGKTIVSDEEFEFVLRNFQMEIIYSGLGLTSIDFKVIKLLSENERLKAEKIAKTLKISKREIGKILRSLNCKGFINAERSGSTLSWYLAPLGYKLKEVL